MKSIITILVIAGFVQICANNPTSANYILQQAGLSTGNNTANPSTSQNYVLQAASLGDISGKEQSSENYANFPGYYLGEIIGEILPSQNVTISVTDVNVIISWDAVTNANSYKIYSSDDPHENFENWTLEASGIAATSWSQILQNAKKFYCVVASTQSATRSKKTDYNRK